MKQTETTQQVNAIELLVKFVNQRPGLDFCNYGDISAYRQESREITKDKHDFNELLTLALRRVDNLNAKLVDLLSNTSGRLILKGDTLEYCTGQYFPTEYRPAACRALRDLIWADYRDEKDSEGNPVYSDGHQIRKAINRNLSRRVAKNYFN